MKYAVLHKRELCVVCSAAQEGTMCSTHHFAGSGSIIFSKDPDPDPDPDPDLAEKLHMTSFGRLWKQ